MQINQYTNTATVIGENDYLDLDKFISAGVYQSNKILGSSVINQLGANFANTNLTLTGNRSHDGNSNRLTMAKFKDFTFETFIAPTLGLASLNFNGYGALASDLTHDFNSDNGTTLRMYGDNTIRAYGLMGVNGMNPTTGYGVYSTGSISGFRGEGYYGVLGVGTNTGVLGNCDTGIGVEGTATTGIGIRAVNTTNNVALYSNGKAYVEEYGLGAGIDASAIFQVNSTLRGVLLPRMTTTQINAIAAPSEGLIVYNTTLSHLCFKDPSGWRKISHSAM